MGKNLLISFRDHYHKCKLRGTGKIKTFSGGWCSLRFAEWKIEFLDKFTEEERAFILGE